MRDQFEEIKNGCPWIVITENEDGGMESHCQATKDICWYKGCAVLYWLRNMTYEEKD